MSTEVKKKTAKATAAKTTAKKTTRNTTKATAKKTTARKSKVSTAPKYVPSMDEVRERAFEIFVRRGCEPGREMQDWLQAEQELISAN